MPFTSRQSVAGVVAGSVANAFVVVLGLVVPLTDPARDRVDNALISLGAIGVLLALLLPVSGMMSRGDATRAALRVYVVVSLLAVLVADFGARPQLGWAIKIPTVVVTAVAVHRLALPDSSYRKEGSRPS